MNPSRLYRLYDARFPNGVRSGHRSGYRGQMPAAQGGPRYVDLSPRPDNEDDGTLLAAYFLGGD